MLDVGDRLVALSKKRLRGDGCTDVRVQYIELRIRNNQFQEWRKMEEEAKEEAEHNNVNDVAAVCVQKKQNAVAATAGVLLASKLA